MVVLLNSTDRGEIAHRGCIKKGGRASVIVSKFLALEDYF